MKPDTLKDKELVVFDLDGTLAPSKQPMEPDMAIFMDKLLSRIKVAVISGGGFPQFETQFLNSFPAGVDGFVNLYLLPTSGTKFLVWNNVWVEVYAEHLSPKEKEMVMMSLHSSLNENGYVQPAKVYGQIIEDRGSQITFSALGQNAPLELKKAWDPTLEKRLKIAESLKKRIPGFDVRVGGTTSIDITRRGVNKAYGIRKLEQYLKLSLEKIVFVGDALYYGGNDYPAKTTGVDCIQVADPSDTKKLIAGWLK
jgi:hypothetical protein